MLDVFDGVRKQHNVMLLYLALVVYKLATIKCGWNLPPCCCSEHEETIFAEPYSCGESKGFLVLIAFWFPCRSLRHPADRGRHRLRVSCGPSVFVHVLQPTLLGDSSNHEFVISKDHL